MRKERTVFNCTFTKAEARFVMILLGTQKFEGKTFVATVTLKTSRKSAMELFDMEIKHACAMQKTLKRTMFQVAILASHSLVLNQPT